MPYRKFGNVVVNSEGGIAQGYCVSCERSLVFVKPGGWERIKIWASRHVCLEEDGTGDHEHLSNVRL